MGARGRGRRTDPLPVPVPGARRASRWSPGTSSPSSTRVITRSYGLGVLLLVVALTCLGRVRPRWTAGTIGSRCSRGRASPARCSQVRSQLVVAWRWWRARRDGDAPRGAITCALVTAGSAGLAALTCIPPSDFHSFSLGIPNSTDAYLEPSRLAAALGGTWRGLVPVPVGVGRWNTNVVDQLGDVSLQALLSDCAFRAEVARVFRAVHDRLSRSGSSAPSSYVLFSVVVVLPDPRPLPPGSSCCCSWRTHGSRTRRPRWRSSGADELVGGTAGGAAGRAGRAGRGDRRDPPGCHCPPVRTRPYAGRGRGRHQALPPATSSAARTSTAPPWPGTSTAPVYSIARRSRCASS